VAQTTSDRCRMVSLWTAVERTWSVLKYFICGCEVTFSHKHIHIFVESNKTQNGRQSEQRQTIQTLTVLSGLLSGWSLLLLALGVWDTKLSRFGLFVFVHFVDHFEFYSTQQQYVYICEKVTSHRQMK
jgi:hypothetical protein